MQRLNWDDLRFVLAVERSGSIAAAARDLGVAHTTVLRRISALEAQTGSSLFDLTPTGYVVSPDQRRTFSAIKAAGDAILEAEAAMMDAAIAPGMSLRLTSTDTFCSAILPSVVGKICSQYEGLSISLMSFNSHANMSHGRADLAIRPTSELSDDLVGDRLGDLGFAVYENANRNWIGLSGSLTRSVAGEWMAENVSTSDLHADSFIVVRELIGTGLGCCYLPCFLGDNYPNLTRNPDFPHLTTPIWLAGHRELSDTGFLKKIRKSIVREFTEISGDLLGKS